MATIYSNRNDGVSTHTTVDPNVGTTWSGGAVPATTDIVYVVGRRTTINMTAFGKWAGVKTITVASTANFAASGFFYTVTDRGQIIKVNYTSLTGTTFVDCTLDESDTFYAWDDAGSIANGSYVHNPAYIIEIGVGQTFECTELYIEQGGWLFVNGGTLKINQGIVVRDGRLVGRNVGNAGEILISRTAGTTAASTVGYFNIENYQLQVVDIDGSEVRSTALTTSTISKGDGSVTIGAPVNGSFAVGDDVAIYQENDYRRRNKGYTGYRDNTCSFRDMDEGFDVVGINGSTVYLGLKNGSRGKVLASSTDGSQKVLEVQPKSNYFKASDKVVINNQVYTIDSVEDSEVQLYYYDFTNPSTSLSDFWVNDATHIYSANWVIEDGVGLKNTDASYRELVHKFLWTREVIIEAEMSPLDGYNSGTRGTTSFGIMAAYDPAFRWGHRTFDGSKCDYLVNNDSGDQIYYHIRSMTNYPTNRPSRDTTLKTLLRGPVKYRVESRKFLTKVTFNGEEFTTEFRRDGHYKGLVGLYNNGNLYCRIRSLTIKMPTQKIRITTANTIAVDSMVYQTGAENNHPIGSKIVKLGSINTGNGSHKDLAFAYSGQDGSGVFPIITQLNGVNTTNSSFPWLHNHDMNVDYYYNLGDIAARRSITIDLTAQKTFTHVSFVPRVDDGTGFYGYNGVAIYGSNDGTAWTTLYGPTADTKKWYGGGGSYNRMAYYPTGTASYRYVKFETAGDQSASRNRYVNIGVHNFSEGYTLDLNNASDFNIGDTITVLSDSGYSRGSREYEAYQARILASGADPETYFHGGWLNECTITNKIGNKIYLDKPVWWGYIEDADSVLVVKTNRKFKISGFLGTTSVFADSWRWPDIYILAGSASGRKIFFKNVRLNYIGSYRYSGSTNYNRGVRVYTYDYWNATVFDGISMMTGSDGGTYSGFGSYQGHMIVRNCMIAGIYTGIWGIYSPSYSGFAAFNNKILNCVLGIYQEQVKVFANNYNEIAGCNDGIQYHSPYSDKSIVPFPNEVRRNIVKGSSNIGYRQNREGIGPIRATSVKFEYNKVRAMDDYAVYSGIYSGNDIGSDFMSEHTGSRISRYRNEGFIYEGELGSDLSYIVQRDFGRFGYDFGDGIYNHVVRQHSEPDTLRVYSCQGDAYYLILGLELEILDDVPFQVHISFDYRLSWLGKIQDDGPNDGRISVHSIQNGTLIGTDFGIVPTSLTRDWNNFSATLSLFTASNGRAAVNLNRSGNNGWMDLRNVSAKVLTDHPESIRVVGNTFNVSRLFDQYRETRDMAPLTRANNKTVKFKRIKL